MRLILDTSVIVASIRSPFGASRLLVDLGLKGRFEWLISVATFLEFEAVLHRPEHLLKSGLSGADIDRLLDRIVLACTSVIVWRPADIYLPDAEDEHVLALALCGWADAVVTHNRRHFASLPGTYGVPLQSPGEALKSFGRDKPWKAT